MTDYAICWFENTPNIDFGNVDIIFFSSYGERPVTNIFLSPPRGIQ